MPVRTRTNTTPASASSAKTVSVLLMSGRRHPFPVQVAEFQETLEHAEGVARFAELAVAGDDLQQPQHPRPVGRGQLRRNQAIPIKVRPDVVEFPQRLQRVLVVAEI